jgi:hypothetical protein
VTPVPPSVLETFERALDVLERSLDAVRRTPTVRDLTRLLTAVEVVIEAGRAALRAARGEPEPAEYSGDGSGR